MVFLLADAREGEPPATSSQQASSDEGGAPGSEKALAPSEAEAEAAAADLAEASDAQAPVFGDPAQPGFSRGAAGQGDSQSPGDEGLTSGSGGDGDPTAEEIEEAIERARSIQRLEAGRLAARNNAARPAAIEKALNAPSFVPPEVQEAAEGSSDTPPEILAAMRERYDTPPEIAESMAEAAERGTSDAMRAYMAGETDQRPAH